MRASNIYTGIPVMLSVHLHQHSQSQPFLCCQVSSRNLTLRNTSSLTFAENCLETIIIFTATQRLSVLKATSRTIAEQKKYFLFCYFHSNLTKNEIWKRVLRRFDSRDAWFITGRIWRNDVSQLRSRSDQRLRYTETRICSYIGPLAACGSRLCTV